MKYFSVAREAPTNEGENELKNAKTERPPDPKPSETVKEDPKVSSRIDNNHNYPTAGPI